MGADSLGQEESKDNKPEEAHDFEILKVEDNPEEDQANLDNIDEPVLIKTSSAPSKEKRKLTQL